MRARNVIILALAVLVLLAPASLAQGTLYGQVINGSRGAPRLPPGVPVVLHALKDNNIISKANTRTDATSIFVFTDSDAEADITYLAATEYLGVPYYSNLVSFDQGQVSATLVITVYETTTLPSVITCDLANFIIDFGKHSLRLQEVLSVNNTSDRIYTGQADPELDNKMVTLRFWLPHDATELRVGNGDDQTSIIRTGDGFCETQAVSPGSHDYSFSYALSYTGTAYHLEKVLYYPTAQFNLLVANTGATVQSPQLTAHGSRQTGQGSYLFFSAEDLAADTRLHIELSNLPQAGTQRTISQGRSVTTTDRILKWLVLCAGVACLLTALSYPFVRRQRSVAATTARTSSLQEREQLLHSLADLDDPFAVGDTGEADYRRQRSAQKARLIRVLEQLEEQR